jgi:hypothetical protein
MNEIGYDKQMLAREIEIGNAYRFYAFIHPNKQDKSKIYRRRVTSRSSTIRID